MTAVLADCGQRFGIEGFGPYCGRDLTGVRNVRVYRNLNEQRRTGRRRWSIFDRDSGLVVGHADKLAVQHAWVHVNVAAQERIFAGQFRTVHAWINGELAFTPTDLSPWYSHCTEVTYDPTVSRLFRFVGSDRVFLDGPLVRFDALGMWAWEA